MHSSTYRCQIENNVSEKMPVDAFRWNSKTLKATKKHVSAIKKIY